MVQSHKSAFWGNILMLKHCENNELYRKNPKVNLGQMSLRHIILLSDWSVGSSPFCKQTEMDLTPFEKKKPTDFSWPFFLLPLCDGNFNFSLASSYRAYENLYIKAKKSNLMKNWPNPFCNWALHIKIHLDILCHLYNFVLPSLFL